MEKNQLKAPLSELEANVEKRRENALAAAAQRVTRGAEKPAGPRVKPLANCGD